MEKIDVIERAANRLLQHNVAEARIAIELMQESHDQRVIIKSYRQGMATAGCFSEHKFIYIIWLWR